MKFDSVRLETQRLVLRQLTESDVEGIFSIFSDTESMKYWSHSAYQNESQARERVNRTVSNMSDGHELSLAVELKEDGAFIGNINLFSFHEESKRAEIGYILKSDYWKQGLMSEAIEAVIQYALTVLNLNRLEADIDPCNIASAQLLKRVGFDREGLLKERWIINGVVSDSEMFGLTKSKKYP